MAPKSIGSRISATIAKFSSKKHRFSDSVAHIPPAKWTAFLSRSKLKTQDSKASRVIAPHRQRTRGEELKDLKPDPPREHTTLVIELFKQFHDQNCGKIHEIKLRVPQEGQPHLSNARMQMFVSCCPDGSSWQDTQCGSYKEVVDETGRDTLCAAILRSQERGQTLYLCSTQRGLSDISHRMPPATSLDYLTMQTFGQLLDQGKFSQITYLDHRHNTATEKFGLREKEALALALARVLMNLIDENLELAMYSSTADGVCFLQLSGKHIPYIALKPRPWGSEPANLLKTLEPGNAIFLSFAKLLLEMKNGERIPMDLHADSRSNITYWGEMCRYLHNAREEGCGNYLQAGSQGRLTGRAASEVLARGIYDHIVRYLELTVTPQATKRKAENPVSDLPPVKKLSLSSELTVKPSSVSLLGDAVPVLPNDKPRKPTRRSEFTIGIVCALAREYDAMVLLMDELWDEVNGYGKAYGDANTYTTGRIGSFNVVMILLGRIGKISAATSSSNLRFSYPGLQFVFITGICGGVPFPPGGHKLILGDVVISRRAVQYDLGRKYPDSFAPRHTTDDNLGKPPEHIYKLLSLLETSHAREQLENLSAVYLQRLQNNAHRKGRGATYRYLGSSNDKLYQPNYHHKHYNSQLCLSAEDKCSNTSVCKASRDLSCADLGCSDKYLIARKRLQWTHQLEKQGETLEAQARSVFVGAFGSGDTVLKSGEDRDRLARQHGLMAFEMEGAGMWEVVPCIVIKGVCDYADSHKDKSWQDFAAATAASVTKAVILKFVQLWDVDNLGR
ncbi:hypothetical protein BJY01DRAFT_258807 [Aspergillus pseudoustus]|uniref:Nucleoside phosphorylase domain-containing protein n=1 Tax=Aspergillus pseudoustus TaxID=1810923 RepID=A0ABR4J7F6_9EURO